MASSTTSNTAVCWEDIKGVIFKNDEFLGSLSNKGLVLLLIGRDLLKFTKNTAKDNEESLQLVLALGHKSKTVSEQFPDVLDSDSKERFVGSLVDNHALDEGEGVITISAGQATLKLHAQSLFNPVARGGKLSESPNCFVDFNEDSMEISESYFISTPNKEGGILSTEYSCATESDKEEKEKFLIIKLQEDICADQIWTWVYQG
ncbi:uncharacterized protein CTRU02_215507 [Colletotrichum truncatum]|uniref:Uncharacterized protein n=1 Tax=Colletotrichum truncatum TaxID=5467 RepID=A0ACC3YCS3_COLTU|nr:uncharacterized protein CTRU02_05547 [Colletotrichum truncatum]KAF6793990.1 hypothetical protein CTRU02_05547 [Colletotrichum truncatum]